MISIDPIMTEEKDLSKLLKTMTPVLNGGEYVFCTIKDLSEIDQSEIISFFRETEGITIIVEKQIADKRQLHYTFVASWITLSVHSSLEAVGLTAAFSAALTKEKISCNVVAGYFHDHIFVHKNDADKAMNALRAIRR
jgi:hypothetical protein